MICLDSDFIIAHLNGDKDASSLVSELEDEDILVTTSINYFEVLSGMLLSERRQENFTNAKQSLDCLEILELGKPEAEIISRIYAASMRNGKSLPQKDLFIGGIAIAAGAAVLTRNTKDFERIPGLKVRKW